MSSIWLSFSMKRVFLCASNPFSKENKRKSKKETQKVFPFPRRMKWKSQNVFERTNAEGRTSSATRQNVMNRRTSLAINATWSLLRLKKQFKHVSAHKSFSLCARLSSQPFSTSHSIQLPTKMCEALFSGSTHVPRAWSERLSFLRLTMPLKLKSDLPSRTSWIASAKIISRECLWGLNLPCLPDGAWRNI